MVKLIKVQENNYKDLEDFKVHPRQSFNEVVGILIKSYKEQIKNGNVTGF